MASLFGPREGEGAGDFATIIGEDEGGRPGGAHGPKTGEEMGDTIGDFLGKSTGDTAGASMGGEAGPKLGEEAGPMPGLVDAVLRARPSGSIRSLPRRIILAVAAPPSPE